jgi:hypothetical protein
MDRSSLSKAKKQVNTSRENPGRQPPQVCEEQSLSNFLDCFRIPESPPFIRSPTPPSWCDWRRTVLSRGCMSWRAVALLFPLLIFAVSLVSGAIGRGAAGAPRGRATASLARGRGAMASRGGAFSGGKRVLDDTTNTNTPGARRGRLKLKKEQPSAATAAVPPTPVVPAPPSATLPQPKDLDTRTLPLPLAGDAGKTEVEGEKVCGGEAERCDDLGDAAVESLTTAQRGGEGRETPAEEKRGGEASIQEEGNSRGEAANAVSLPGHAADEPSDGAAREDKVDEEGGGWECCVCMCVLRDSSLAQRQEHIEACLGGRGGSQGNIAASSSSLARSVPAGQGHIVIQDIPGPSSPAAEAAFEGLVGDVEATEGDARGGGEQTGLNETAAAEEFFSSTYLCEVCGEDLSREGVHGRAVHMDSCCR